MKNPSRSVQISLTGGTPSVDDVKEVERIKTFIKDALVECLQERAAKPELVVSALITNIALVCHASEDHYPGFTKNMAEAMKTAAKLLASSQARAVYDSMLESKH